MEDISCMKRDELLEMRQNLMEDIKQLDKESIMLQEEYIKTLQQIKDILVKFSEEKEEN